MTSLLDGLPQDAREAAVEADPPARLDPMLAELTDERFTDPAWIFERKLDGERFLVFRESGAVRLVTRNRQERNNTYPELVDELEGRGSTDFVVDGEVVAFEGNVTSFSRLQQRMQVREAEEARQRAKRVAVYLYVFDVPWADGWDLSGLPLRARKKVLRSLLDFGGHVRYTPYRNERGEAYWGEACSKGWEGVIAKRAGSPYRSGRSSDWLKLKCVRRQELVVGGFSDPHGSRVGFGALLLGYYDEGALVYAGKVGTGWDDEALEQLRGRMDRIERKTSPFDRGAPPAEGAHWVTPRLVAEVGFTEWTSDGKLRHPRYLGLRSDKEASEVVRETPRAAPHGAS